MMNRPGLEASASRRAGFTLVGIVLVGLLVVEIAALVIATTVMRNYGHDMVRRSFEYVAESTTERTLGSIRLTERAVGLVVFAVEDADQAPEPQSLLRSLYLVVKDQPAVSSVYMGFPDGSYASVARQGDGFSSRVITVEPSRRVVESTHAANFDAVDSTTLGTDYDPRQQPWYVAGREGGEPTWTGPFISTGMTRPQVSLAQAARDDRGDLWGVVGANLNLDEVSKALDGSPVGEDGEAFVLSQDRYVIAAPAEYVAQVNAFALERSALMPADDLGIRTTNPVMPGSSVPAFGRTQRYEVMERQFPADSGLDWVVHVRSTAEALNPGLQQAQRTMLALMGAITLLVVASGAVLLWYWRPLGRQVQVVGDPLTGAAARDDIPELAGEALARAKSAGNMMCVTLMALDGMQSINEVYGYDKGDRVVIAAAEALDRTCRGDDIIVRFTGDQFLIFQALPPTVNPRDLVERIRARTEDSLTGVLGARSRVRVTAGYTHGDPAVMGLADFIADAQAALGYGLTQGVGTTYVRV